jgi:hypothetical protein
MGPPPWDCALHVQRGAVVSGVSPQRRRIVLSILLQYVDGGCGSSTMASQ